MEIGVGLFSQTIGGLVLLIGAFKIPQLYKYLAERKRIDANSKSIINELQGDLEAVIDIFETILPIVESSLADKPDLIKIIHNTSAKIGQMKIRNAHRDANRRNAEQGN